MYRPNISINLSYAQFSTVLVVLSVWNGLNGNVTCDQPVITSITGYKYADLGADTTLRCLWNGSFTRLEWRISTMNETDGYNAAIIVRFDPPDTVGYKDAAKHSLDITDSDNPLTIRNVAMEDKARYWCRLDSVPLSSPAFFDLQVGVPPNSNKANLKANGDALKSGDTFTAEVGDSQTFTLTLVDILPAATFEWKLGSIKTLTESTVSTTQSDGLITSTSTATWMPVTEHDDEVLTCTGTNGGNKINITLNLKVTGKIASTFPVWAIVLIVIVAILIIVGVIVVIYYKMPKNQ